MELADRLDAFNLSLDSIAQRGEILNQLNLSPGETVVDLGCGLGYLCKSMAEKVGKTGHVTGIDIASDLVDLATARNECRWLSYKVGDAMTLTEMNSTFEVAACVQVLEYLPRVDSAIAELFRVLAPKGRAVIVATDWDAVIWHSDQPTRMKAVMAAWRRHCYDAQLPRTVSRKLRTAGFRIEAVSAFPILNLDFQPGRYSYGLAEVIGDFVLGRQLISTDVHRAWVSDLETLDADGRYFFQSNRIIFRISKTSN